MNLVFTIKTPQTQCAYKSTQYRINVRRVIVTSPRERRTTRGGGGEGSCFTINTPHC